MVNPLPGAGCLITGRKPVPLQAGHISSTTSDFIDFIMRADPATNHQSNYLHFSEVAPSIARGNLEQQG
jgi:hypothetical protein